MSALLSMSGHEVHGISHEVLHESHFFLANVQRFLASDSQIDIRDSESLNLGISNVKPDVVVHLAAQALVREGYRKPYETFETNVSGTINVIKACQESQVPNLLVVTSDKVYQGSRNIKFYSEDDALGGKDPYSASKAAADIVTQSLAQLSTSTRISIVRAGNVIGGGDFGHERLIPDLYRAQKSKSPATIRFPNAVRPWQHVLDCLAAYIRIIDHMIKTETFGIWNVGPITKQTISVKSICQKTAEYFGNAEIFQEVEKVEEGMNENPFLQLDASRIHRELGWSPKMDTFQAVEWTLDWYKSAINGESPSKRTEEQINRYYEL